VTILVMDLPPNDSRRRTDTPRSLRKRMHWILCALCFVGVVAFCWFLVIWREVKANWWYEETHCTVVDKQLVDVAADVPMYACRFFLRYSVPNRDKPIEVWAPFHASYFAASSSRSEQEAILHRFQIGQQYSCWYDPDQPHRVVLARGFSTGCFVFPGLIMLFFGVPLLGCLITQFRNRAPDEHGNSDPKRARGA
jgi:uncharacterized protein DUF3592